MSRPAMPVKSPVATAQIPSSPVPFFKPQTPISGGKSAKFPETPIHGPNGNQTAAFGPKVGGGEFSDASSQDISVKEVTASDSVPGHADDEVLTACAGFQQGEKGGNHAQVVVLPEVDADFLAILRNLGGNLTVAPLGRKKVFDDFMQGRLVSLLAMDEVV